MLWYLLVGTRGGENRLRIVDLLQTRRMNAHEAAKELGLDYRTIRHHLVLLEQAGVVTRPLGDVYGSPYEVTAHLLAGLPALDEIRRERSERIRGRSPRPTSNVG
jgi:DNA-binding transcriptional ArsR family regulator